MTTRSGDHRASEPPPTAPATAAAVTLRVAEARVEDIGHAVARLAPADLARIGARPGDVLKITAGTSAVARAELSDASHEGLIQIDGTARSNCGAGLQEQVSVAPVESMEPLTSTRSPASRSASPKN